jgi:O-antigen/teichoic acid export membrane protein
MLKQKLILSYSSKIIVQAIQVVSTIIVARFAGAKVLGMVTFGLAYVTLFTFFADMGIGTAHIKYISEGKDLANSIATFKRIKLFLICFFSIVVIAAFYIQKNLFGYQFETTEHETVIFIFLIVVIFQQLIQIPNITFIGRIEQAKQDIPYSIQNIALQIIRIILAVLGFKAIALSFGNLLAVLISLPISYYLFKGYPNGKYDKDIAKKYIKIALPVTLVIISTILLQNIDNVFVQFFCGSKELGIYAVGYRFGGFILTLSSTVNLIFFPLFSEAVSNKNFIYIKNTIIKYERFLFIFLMPALMFITFNTKLILKILVGQEYMRSANVMNYLFYATFFMLISMPYYNVLNGLSEFKLTSKIYIASVFVFVIMAVILVHPSFMNLGSSGMGLNVFINNTLLVLAFRFLSKKKISEIDLVPSLKYSIIGLIFYIAAAVLFTALNFSIIFKEIILLSLSALMYLAFYMFDLLNSSDFKQLFSIFKINDLIGYIRKEIFTSN